MEPKKNKGLFKLRDKNKPLFNVKMGKKAKKTALRYRRSISVPDLFSEQSMLSLLDPTDQSSFQDSFVGSVHSFGLDETKCETSSLTDSLTATNTTIPVKCSDPYTVPDPPFTKRVLGKRDVPDIPLDQVVTSNALSSARYLDPVTATYTPSSAKALDNLILPNTPPRERPISVSATKDKPDKRTEGKERNTKWYIEDSELSCSTPFEDCSFTYCSPDHDLTGLEPVTPRSTEMFIIGSAEDKNEVSWLVLLF